jgi:predicted transcriptional regulator
MPQDEILEFLEKQYKIDTKKEFTKLQIAKALGRSISSTSRCLKRLFDYDDVKHRQGPPPHNGGWPTLYYQHKEEEPPFKIVQFTLGTKNIYD